MSREELRLIVLYPKEVQEDIEFVSKIAQLGIYDLYFTDQLGTKDILEWINNKKGLAHIENVLQGYRSHDKKEIKQNVVYNNVEREEETETEIENKAKVQELAIINKLKKLSQQSQSDVRTRYRSFVAKAITITSMKGGIGKTDIAINLAVALKTHTNVSRIVVVDFDFPYGGVAASLKLKRTTDLGNWMLKPNESLSEEGIKSRVIKHQGIDFVPMPIRLKDGLKFQETQAEVMIDLLKRHYDIVVIDTSGYSSSAMVAIERSSEVILVTSHDIVSISNALAYKEDLINYFGVDYEKISMFINQVPKIEDITKESIAEVFEDHDNRIPVIGFAPYDDAVRQYRNKGKFIYEEKPSHSFSLGIDMILETLEIIPKSDLRKRQKTTVDGPILAHKINSIFTSFKKSKSQKE